MCARVDVTMHIPLPKHYMRLIPLPPLLSAAFALTLTRPEMFWNGRGHEPSLLLNLWVNFAFGTRNKTFHLRLRAAFSF